MQYEDGQVTFRYKDYADAQRQKTMTLDAAEFLRRFVQHVLPPHVAHMLSTRISQMSIDHVILGLTRLSYTRIVYPPTAGMRRKSKTKSEKSQS